MALKDTIKAPFAVGLLVIFAVAAGLFMVSVLKEGSGTGSEGENALHAVFTDVTGLATQSRVMMSGIPVGKVTSIKLLKSGDARVDFTVRKNITLYQGIRTRTDGSVTYRNGASVAKKQASFIGDYFLEVTPGKAGKKLGDGDQVMNVIEAIGIDQMLDRMDAIAKNVQDVTRSMAAVFGGPQGQKNIQQLLDDLNSILDTLNSFVGQNSDKLDRILTNVEDISDEAQVLTQTGSKSIDSILRDTEAIVQEVRYIVGQSSTDLQSGLGTLKGTLSRLQSTLDSLNYSLQNIQDITDKVNEGEGTLGALVNSPTIAQRTEQILNDAGDFVGRVSKLRTIIDLRSEYHVRNQQLKNVLGIRLQPSEEKYYLIELVDDFRGKTEIVQENVNSTKPDEVGSWTTTTVRTTDDFKFSVEFARSLFPTPWFGFTGRFGLIESSGGIGLDLILLEDRSLKLQSDLFDFGEDVYPRLRTEVSWQFLSWAYILAGVDDIMNPERREYMLGAGIRFDDEDLKAILTTTGVPSP